MSTNAVVTPQTPAWHEPLLQFLPVVRAIAVQACRGHRPADREEAIQEIIARTTVGWAALAAQGRARFWLIKPLAQYAVRQWSAGRRVGTPANQRDLFSPRSRRDVRFWSLGPFPENRSDNWRAAVADSRHTNPAEAACFRIDFEHWLGKLPERHRQAAVFFAEGDAPGMVARRLNVSPGRISQLRAEMRASWEQFQSDRPDRGQVTAAT